jgi:hypothetical protein
MPRVVAAEAPRIAVLDFELNDLTVNPRSAEEIERTASIKSSLEEALASRHGYPIAAVDPKAQQAADQGFGYLFDHSDAAAALARQFGADWIIVGRVHKASYLFVYFKARVVNVKTGELAGDLVVEVKGPQKKLTIRGVESLADRIDETLKQPPSGTTLAH